MVTTSVFAPRRLGIAFTRVILVTCIIALLSTGVVVLPASLSTSAMAFAFHSSFVDQDPAPTLLPGATTTHSLRFRNVGLAAWQRGSGAQVTLAVKGDATTFAEAGMGVDWLFPNRLATTAEQLVLPGMIGTFTFTVRAPSTPGVYRTPLRLVVDGLTWLEDENVALELKSDLGFHGKLVDQPLHPTLKPGELSAPLTLRLRNTGARTWVRGAAGQQVTLGIAGDDQSLGALAAGWPTANRVAVQNEPTVGPSGIATFTFRVRAPATPAIYALRLRPVIDGLMWLEDEAIVTLVTVVSGSGAPTAPATGEATKNVIAPSFTTTASAEPASVRPGARVTLTAGFTTPIAGAAVLGIQVFDPTGSSLVYQKWFHSETFAAGEPRSYPVVWDIPVGAASGTYVVNATAYSAGWKQLLVARSSPGSFSVIAPASQPTAPPAVPTTAPSAAPSAAPTGSTAPSQAPTPAPSAAATPVASPPPSFAANASTSPATVTPGGSISITARVTSAAAASALVDIEVYAPGGASPAYQIWFDNQSFSAGQERTYPATWQVPTSAALGTYIVKVGVYAPGWASLYGWADPAATFQVVAPTPTPTPTPVPSVTLTPTPPPSASSVNDTVFTYLGVWSTATGSGKYLGDDHFSDTSGSAFTITFSGTSLRLYSAVAAWHGIGAVSVDGGPESDVDFYAATRQEQALVYATPALANGTHTVRLRVTGRKNAASTGFVVTADRADVAGSVVVPTPTPAPTPTLPPSLPPTPTPTIAPPPPPTPAPGPFSLIPSDRLTSWNPGVPGGIPARSTVCSSVNAATYGNGAQDARGAIQAALDACPVGQVVQLSAGDFKVSSTMFLTKGVVLRGQGPTATRLKMPFGTQASVILIGTQWFSFTQTVNLASNAVKGARSVTLASNPGLVAGEIVVIDTLTNASVSKWGSGSPPGDPSRGWFTRPNRPLGQVLEVASASGTTVTFTTPFHIDLRTSDSAQLSRFSSNGGPVQPSVKYAGVENLYVSGGGDGNIKFENAAYSWVSNIESDAQIGEGVALDASFRCVVRDSYVHSTRQPSPGGGGYGISFAFYSADNLVENNIVWNMNKVMVMRASGGGNVIGYNYMEDGWIDSYPGWVETGLNASHLTTPHYELFEGNQSFNFDGDNTWGNAVYITAFRNHLTGKRRAIGPVRVTDTDNRRAIGLMEGHWWYSLVGNVLGYAGMSPAPAAAFTYESAYPWQDDPAIWRLGYNPENWNAQADPKVLSTVIREGNYDYLTNLVHWTGAPQQLPASLYLSAKPAFFGSNPWPWVDPTGATKVFTLPARARFDAMPSH